MNAELASSGRYMLHDVQIDLSSVEAMQAVAGGSELAFMFSSAVVLTSFTLTILPIPFLWWLRLSSCLGRNSSSITTIFVRNFTALVIELGKVSLPDY